MPIHIVDTNLHPVGNYYCEMHNRLEFWPLYTDNLMNYDANYVLNSHDLYRGIQLSDISILFHVLLILFRILHFNILVLIFCIVCLQMNCVFVSEGACVMVA